MGMPFEESSIVTERTKFVLEWRKRWEMARGRRVDLAELCRMFGVSRQTGYRWIRRFVAAGYDVRAMVDRSSRPRTIPTAVSEAMEEFIVSKRKQWPRSGPRMLRARLMALYPGREFPSASTFGNIFKRNGLSKNRRRQQRSRVPALAPPLGVASAPNSIWCIDFKGDFLTSDGERCYPLTIIDAYSRFCIRCEVCDEISGKNVQRILDSAFREFGLPATIRSDNGSPFAANGPAGLSSLAAWLLRLGIRLERIAPGKPQQNGRQERFHRTLKEDAVTPPASSLRAQQRRFDLFRCDYNDARPHQSLAMKPPGSVYFASSRKYPRELLSPALNGYPRRIERDGTLLWNDRRLFISSALVGETVGIAPAGDFKWVVSFGDVELGYFIESADKSSFVANPRRRKPHFLELNSVEFRD